MFFSDTFKKMTLESTNLDLQTIGKVNNILTYLYKVLGVLRGLQIKALFPTLIVDDLGLSLVKAFRMLSCDWPRDQQNNDCGINNDCQGCQLIFSLSIPKKHQLLSYISSAYTEYNKNRNKRRFFFRNTCPTTILEKLGRYV